MIETATRCVLVIEDDRTLNRMLVDQLRRDGYDAVGAHTAAEARKLTERAEPRLAILDMRLPDSDGLELIPWLDELCPVVVLTAYGSIEQAVQAVQAGAAEYLVKPVSRQRLQITVKRVLESALMKRDLAFLQARGKERAGPRLVGTSPALRKVIEMVGIVARSDTTVLIEGESGVGKELVAHAIHEESPRAGAHFVAIDCCTLQENLLESELFGHERGAFTGAERKKEGLIEVAEGGTVFLDEIGEISPAIQAKLLRVLETGHFRRLGGTRDLAANVRFVAATNRSLREMVRARTFRDDLFYRLSAFSVTVPPLRERREDIAPIAEHFLATRQFNRNVDKRFDAQALRAMERYSWPGNIRELRNVVERGILMSKDARTIRAEHLSIPDAPAGRGAGLTLSFDREPTMEEVREAYLAHLVEAHSGSCARIARAMGMSERNTHRMLKKLGEEVEESGPA